MLTKGRAATFYLRWTVKRRERSTRSTLVWVNPADCWRSAYRRAADFVRSKYSHAGVSVYGLRIPLAMCRQVPRPKSWSSTNWRQLPHVFGGSVRKPWKSWRCVIPSSDVIGSGWRKSSSVTCGWCVQRSRECCSCRRSRLRFFLRPT